MAWVEQKVILEYLDGDLLGRELERIYGPGNYGIKVRSSIPSYNERSLTYNTDQGRGV